jgi:helicase
VTKTPAVADALANAGNEPSMGHVPARGVHWEKATGIPEDHPPTDKTDVRCVLPDGVQFDSPASQLSEAGVQVRRVRYLVERELVTGQRGAGADDETSLTAKPRFWVGAAAEGTGSAAIRWPVSASAGDAFEVLWEAHDPAVSMEWDPVPASSVGVPDEWLPYLHHTTLNPTQMAAAGRILDAESHVVVTAPTGAGKTNVGMLAVLKAVLGEGRRAAWLVPQRSLTEELDRELESWRHHGLRVERLSGDAVSDAVKVREAHLWVATTEKFEALCRTVSMRSALAEVGCLVVDEIHMLGNQERGPVLEALLARVRGAGSPVRIVGLSATVANAGEVATWLGADLVQTTWRPTRLTWQLPMMPVMNRWAGRAMRLRMAVELTGMVTDDDGSVLVFCGSKRAVRETAVAVAAARRGVVAARADVDVDDLEAVHHFCWEVGVGLHYSDWEYKRDAERAFRLRELSVLVATTTVAAGVNLPARAVVVRDTTVGLDEIDVATVMQMFGRAGRVGAGEREGWAFLLVDESERPLWQERLVEGFTVWSRIRDAVADHVLAEVALHRVGSADDAAEWWERTLAFHQGDRDFAPMVKALEFLISTGFLNEREGGRLEATELGLLTTRFMVPVEVASDLREALAQLPAPANPTEAERALIDAVATLTPTLADIQVSDALRPAVTRLARQWLGNSGDGAGLVPCVEGAGEFARVVLYQAAWDPTAFKSRARAVKGLPVSLMNVVMEEAPRLFGWLAGQGVFMEVHPWVAIVAADLARRIRWRRLAPARGAGRLLWACEQMVTPAHAEKEVPSLMRSARRRGVLSPDWPPGKAPKGCQLDEAGYQLLLRERTTETMPWVTSHAPRLGLSTGAQPVLWAAEAYGPPDAFEAREGVERALFTRRGDYCAGGWLSAYGFENSATER